MIAQKVFDEKLSVREVEKLVKNLNKPPKPAKIENSTLNIIYQDISEKAKAVPRDKSIDPGEENGSGKIEIEFYNHEDLDRLLEQITR